MKSLYESILKSTNSGKEKFCITEEVLFERGYHTEENSRITYYYQTNEKGIILVNRCLYRNKNNNDFLFRFKLDHKTYKVIVKTTNELVKIEQFWEIIDTIGISEESKRILKEIKDHFELEK